ncbi:hypothetical protein [Acidipila rosea]|uniref:Uncharacterized protein n=1 Tax=Acidipila rosea TaxID=768535 RepID=A0A4R1L3B3_9BACT|nr:hypothetical protein [Acidipila rosea]TCK72526.1 hypothetical protein C7378_2108 [Acidipila rosea]
MAEIKDEGFARGGLGFASGVLFFAAAFLVKLGLLHALEKKNI